MENVELTGAFVLSKSRQERVLKGFVSTNSLDADKDISPPESFNLAKYMQIRALLYNHKFWKDAQGNDIPIGETLLAVPAKLVESENDFEWGVKNLNDGAVIDTFPKNRVPDMTAGDRGIWVNTRVDVDDVWDRVVLGTLNGYSWYGLASTIQSQIGKAKKKICDYIEPSELSLVYAPADQDALFVVKAKSAIGGTQIDVLNTKSELRLQSLVFSKPVFDEDSAKAWVVENDFDDSTMLVSEDGEYVFLQASASMFKDGTQRSVKMGKGVQAFVALPVEGTEVEKSALLATTEKLFGCKIHEVEQMTKKKDAPAVNDDATIVAKADPIKVEATVEVKADAVNAGKVEAPAEVKVEAIVEPAKAVEAAVEPAKVEPAKAEEAVTVKAEAITPVTADAKAELKRNEAVDDTTVTKIADAVKQLLVAQFQNVFSGFTESISQFTDIGKKLVAVFQAQADALVGLANKPSIQPVMAKSAVGNEDGKSEVVKEAEVLNTKIAELSARLETLQKSVVTETIREETRVPAEPKSNDPNWMFGAKWFMR